MVCALPKGGAADAPLPVVIMLDITGITRYDDTLYKAIRAQLSDASLQLNHLTTDDSQFVPADPLDSLSKMATDRGADIVFWIEEEGALCTIHFYNRHASERQIFTRELDLASENQLSRSDTIANAVSSIVEESISAVSAKEQHADDGPAPPPPPPRNPPPPPAARQMGVNLFAAYSGIYFSSRSVTHGGRIGVALLPLKHLAIALSYTYNVPKKWESSRYQLTLTSSNIEMSFAARVPAGVFEFRLGAAWSLDLRSYSTSTYVATITPRPGDLITVHSIIPFVDAIWKISDHVGVSAGIGANIAVNEKAYLISRNDGSEYFVLTPFVTKLTYRLGVVLQL